MVLLRLQCLSRNIHHGSDWYLSFEEEEVAGYRVLLFQKSFLYRTRGSAEKLFLDGSIHQQVESQEFQIRMDDILVPIRYATVPIKRDSQRQLLPPDLQGNLSGQNLSLCKHGRGRYQVRICFSVLLQGVHRISINLSRYHFFLRNLKSKIGRALFQTCILCGKSHSFDI